MVASGQGELEETLLSTGKGVGQVREGGLGEKTETLETETLGVDLDIEISRGTMSVTEESLRLILIHQEG